MNPSAASFMGHESSAASANYDTNNELIMIERVLFIGTQFSILYTSMYSPAEAATPRA